MNRYNGLVDFIYRPESHLFSSDLAVIGILLQEGVLFHRQLGP